MPSFHTARPPDRLSLAHDLGRISTLDVPTEEGTERNGPLFGPITEHPSLRNNKGTWGVWGAGVGRWPCGKSCPSYAVSSTTHYSLWMCQCRAVLSKRIFQHHPLQSMNVVNVELFYPKELSARTEFSSFAPSMWWWSLVPCGCWAYELWLVCPRWWISLMCLCGIDGHEWRYLWKPEEGMRSFGAGVKSVEKSQMWVLCESSMC